MLPFLFYYNNRLNLDRVYRNPLYYNNLRMLKCLLS